MILSPKILLSLAAAAISLCPRGASAGHTAPRDNSTAPLRLNSDSYKTTPEDLADAHAKFTAYLSNHTGKLQAPDLPPPVLPSKITLSNATADEVARARKLVDEANEQQGRYNLWRIAHPRRDGADLGKGPNARNHQRQVETAHDKVRREVDEQGAPAPPVLDAALRAAAELVHRTDTQERYNNGTLQQYSNVGEDFPVPGRGGKLLRRGAATAGAGTWLEEQDHSLSQQPFHPDKDYKVWRNVKDYGAKGDGITDDTKAIQKAISDGRRCGKDCPEQSFSGALVYFPNGTYIVKESITIYYNTQIVGGRTATIKSARNFFGMGIFSTDVYLPDGHSEWYLNTSNFYRSLRGIVFDLTDTRTKGMVAVHWQTAQATAIEQVIIQLSEDASTTQIGIFAENGSGGWMSDLSVRGGEYGMLVGSQQYSVSRIYIVASKKCVGLIWNWVFVWSHMRLDSCGVAFDATANGATKESPPGSLSIVDSVIDKCTTAIKTFPFDPAGAKQQGTTLISIAQTYILSTPTFIDGAAAAGKKDGLIKHWQYGNTYADGGKHTGVYEDKDLTRPEKLIDGDGYFFSEGKEDWTDKDTKETVVNARIYAHGDGKTDDTIAMQVAFDYAAGNGFLLYIPAGVYVITSPITIPTGARIRGEVWSQLMAVGDKFADASNPAAMITVGKNELDGKVVMENLLFTSRGALPGLAMVQWSISGKNPGDVALRDCHFRVGGAVGTDLQKANCPKLTGSIDPKCIAGAVMLQVTRLGGGGYFENMWAWVADHDLDDPAGDESNQISIYFARGILINSDKPSWWRGTASEHSVMYQYNVAQANDVYMSIIQTESPYFQGSAFAQAPAPFKPNPGHFFGDPTFEACGANTTNCNAAWALMVTNSFRVFIDGAGLYSWFQNYDQSTCVEKSNCQQRLVNIFSSVHVYLSHMVTIGSVEALTPGFADYYNRIVMASETVAAAKYPWWTGIGAYLDNISDVDKQGSDGSPFPIHNGFVSFGDSYAAGIGAGPEYDDDDNDDNEHKCYRRCGSYPAILNSLVLAAVPSEKHMDWQFHACSGATARQFIDNEGSKQLDKWFPDTSDVVTVSFTGNDLFFGKIVAGCLMGYGSPAEKDCEDGLAGARAALEGETVQGLVHDVLSAITAKANGKRLRIYWNGYPRFFDPSTSQCDGAYFSALNWYKGRYLKQTLRRDFNTLSSKLNDALEFGIRLWNGRSTYRNVYFIRPDDDDTLAVYKGHRFCEPGKNEILPDNEQAAVAFFYPAGPDDEPTAGDGFHMPPPKNAKRSAQSGNSSVNSATCDDTYDESLPLSAMPCSVAKLMANNTIATTGNDPSYEGIDAKREADGSVTINGGLLGDRYDKMFHPKTRANWHIAQYILQDLRKRQFEN